MQDEIEVMKQALCMVVVYRKTIRTVLERCACTCQTSIQQDRKVLGFLAEFHRKILPALCSGGSPDPPECVREPSGTRPTGENAKNRFSVEKKRLKLFAGAGFSAILRPGRGPKIDPKSTFGRQEDAEERIFTDFCRFFAASTLGSTPRGDFGRSEL